LLQFVDSHHNANANKRIPPNRAIVLFPWCYNNLLLVNSHSKIFIEQNSNVLLWTISLSLYNLALSSRVCWELPGCFCWVDSSIFHNHSQSIL